MSKSQPDIIRQRIDAGPMTAAQILIIAIGFTLSMG